MYIHVSIHTLTPQIIQRDRQKKEEEEGGEGEGRKRRRKEKEEGREAGERIKIRREKGIDSELTVDF